MPIAKGNLLALPLLLASLVFSRLALAALGGDESSIEVDRIHLKAAASVRHAPRYVLHEMVGPGGTTVRQYVSPAGKVFAVGWSGPVLPDLRQVLGSHFERYVAAAKRTRYPRTPIMVQGTDLVVVTGGHLRAFRGRAYLPELVPSDVEPETLR